MSKLIVSILTNLPQNQIFNYLLPNRQIDHRRLIYRKNYIYSHVSTKISVRREFFLSPTLIFYNHNLIDFIDLNYHQSDLI